MKAIIHCGAYHTASTTIQNTAWRNRDYLQKRGILYPQTGLPMTRGGQPRYGHDLLAGKTDSADYAERLDKLAEEVRTAQPDTIFLSSDSWFTPAGATSLQAVIDCLKKAGCTEFSGVVFLGNINDAMVHGFRDAVTHAGFHRPFVQFAAANQPLFDVLAIAKEMRTVFQDALTFFSADEATGASRLLFEKLDVPPDHLASPANIAPSPGCLETEAFRLLLQYDISMENLPPVGLIFNVFGLNVGDRGFVELLPDQLMQRYNADYVQALAETTGLDNATTTELLRKKASDKINIALLSPVLEKMLFEWLKASKNTR